MSQRDFRECWMDVEAAVARHYVVSGKHDQISTDDASIREMHLAVSAFDLALRNGNCPSERLPGYSDAEESLARLVMIVMEFASGACLEIPEAIEQLLQSDRETYHAEQQRARESNGSEDVEASGGADRELDTGVEG